MLLQFKVNVRVISFFCSLGLSAVGAHPVMASDKKIEVVASNQAGLLHIVIHARNANSAQIIERLSQTLDLEVLGELPIRQLRIDGTIEGSMSSVLNRVLRNTNFIFIERQGAPRRLVVYSSKTNRERVHKARAGKAVWGGKAKNGSGSLKVYRKLRDLSFNRSPASAEAASDILLSHEDPSIRRAAAKVLAGYSSEGVVSTLVTASKDRDSSVRGQAIVSLGKTRARSAAMHLIDILHNARDVDSAVNAANALGSFNYPEVRAALARASSNDNRRIQLASRWSLGRLKAASP